MDGEARARVEVRIRGRVQGVGFRYFTVRAARRHGVVGRVRNLPDGGLEVRAAAPAEVLERFLAELRSGPPGSRVTDLERRDLPGPGEPAWEDFDVAY